MSATGRGAERRARFLHTTVPSPCAIASISSSRIPPYSIALEFIEAALSMRKSQGVVAFLLRINFLGSQERADWHRAHPCKLYVLPRRPSFTGGGTDATEYAWFVWGEGHEAGTWEILDEEPTERKAAVLLPEKRPVERFERLELL